MDHLKLFLYRRETHTVVRCIPFRIRQILTHSSRHSPRKKFGYVSTLCSFNVIESSFDSIICLGLAFYAINNSNSRRWFLVLNRFAKPPIWSRVELGCPRERFSAITSGKLSDFLQAYKKAYYTQHIKKLGSSELILIELFLHGRVLWKFLKWQFRKF